MYTLRSPLVTASLNVFDGKAFFRIAVFLVVCAKGRIQLSSTPSGLISSISSLRFWLFRQQQPQTDISFQTTKRVFKDLNVVPFLAVSNRPLSVWALSRSYFRYQTVPLKIAFFREYTHE